MILVKHSHFIAWLTYLSDTARVLEQQTTTCIVRLEFLFIEAKNNYLDTPAAIESLELSQTTAPTVSWISLELSSCGLSSGNSAFHLVHRAFAREEMRDSGRTVSTMAPFPFDERERANVRAPSLTRVLKRWESGSNSAWIKM